MRSSLALLVLLLAAGPRVAEAQRSCVGGTHIGERAAERPLAVAVPTRGRAADRAGGGLVGEAPVARSVPERVGRIPVRPPLALPNAGFPLFVPERSPSARPRDADAVSAEPAAAPAEARAGVVRKRAENVYYEVNGTSRAAIAAALRARGPGIQGRRFFGLTEWEVSAGYRPTENAGRCVIDDLTVHVAITTHLPRWRRSAAASKALSGAWDRFIDALARHEHGHRALAEEAADIIRHRLLAVAAPTCDRLDLTAQRAMAAVMQTYEARNLAYDAETSHGRTQGAVWPR